MRKATIKDIESLTQSIEAKNERLGKVGVDVVNMMEDVVLAAPPPIILVAEPMK